jgi:hypothetical protein
VNWLTTNPNYVRDAQLVAGQIVAARCRVYVKYPITTGGKGGQSKDFSNIAAMQTIPVNFNSKLWAIDAPRIDKFKDSFYESLLALLITMYCVLMWFLPFHYALGAVTCVASVVVVLLGWMNIANVGYNAISYAALICAIGFSIDYFTHLFHFAHHAGPPGTPLNERMTYFIEHAGYDVFHGCVTAFMGCSVLIAGGARLLRMMTGLLLVITGTGGIFALFALPSVLSFFSNNKRIEEKPFAEVTVVGSSST